MNRERVENLCERGILGLVLAILVFGPLATGAVRPVEFVIIQFLTLAAAGLWIVRLWVAERPQFLWPPACWAVLAFTVYAVGRYFTADIEYVARQELIRVLVYALIFLVTVNNLYRQDSVQLIAFTVIFLGLVVAGYAAYQFLSGSDRVWTFVSTYKGRASGTYFCPNHLAGFLEMVLPLALGYTIAGRVKPVLRVLLGYAALVMVFGIAMTISRGGWLATGGALVVFLALLFLRRNLGLSALLALVVVVAAAGFFALRSPELKERFRAAFPEGSPAKAEDIRFELWSPAWQMWRAQPWFGVGPAHFDRVFGAYRPQRIQLRPDRVHNDYLNTLADWGVVGAALVMGALVLVAWGVKRTWADVRGAARDLGSNRSNKFGFVLGATVGLTAILLHSFVDFNLHVPANAILAVTLMALLSAHLRFATDDYWFTARLWMRIATTALLLAGVVYLGMQGARRLAETRWLKRAGRESFCSDAQITALKRAYAVEPKNPDTAYRIGEAYRIQSWEGNLNYAPLAESALEWFARAMQLNPHDAYAPLRYAMCLDWLDRQPEAAPYIARAERLDGNNYFIAANLGWHYEQTGEWVIAREWFTRSLRLYWQDNSIARTHLEIVNRRLAEAAAR